MTPYHLTFQLSKVAICPGCNAPLVPQCWTIRLTLAICVKCASSLPAETLHRMMLVQAQHGVEDWSTAHEIAFLTPKNTFPRNVLWHVWALSHYQQNPTQQYPPHHPYRSD